MNPIINQYIHEMVSKFSQFITFFSFAVKCLFQKCNSFFVKVDHYISRVLFERYKCKLKKRSYATHLMPVTEENQLCRSAICSFYYIKKSQVHAQQNEARPSAQQTEHIPTMGYCCLFTSKIGRFRFIDNNYLYYAKELLLANIRRFFNSQKANIINPLNIILMRYLLYVVLLCLFLCSCSKSPGDVEPPAPPILDFSEDPKEDVAAWNTEDFIFDRYYSLIDTMWVVSIPSVTVKYSENSIITITWTVNQKTMANIEVGKLWNENIAKWISTNKLDIGDQKLVPGDHIKAVITIGSNTIIREATIGENKIITDVLGITFGTSKAVVEEKERARVRPYPGSNLYADFPLYEYKSNTAVMFYSTNIRTGTYDGMTIYRFSNGRLSQVGEYTTVIETTDILLNYCRKLGLKETPVITSGEFDQTYVWDNGKIEFCLSIIEDAPPLSPSYPTLRRAIGISYRKL